MEAEALKQQLAARDASLAEAAQRLQVVDAKAGAAAVSHALKVQHGIERPSRSNHLTRQSTAQSLMQPHKPFVELLTSRTHTM